MPVNLRCDCGHELVLQDDEAQELTWCPRCHKVLVEPPGVTAPRSLTRRPAAPQGGGGRGLGIAGFLMLSMLFGLGRAACTSHRPSYDPPRQDIRVPGQPLDGTRGWPALNPKAPGNWPKPARGDQRDDNPIDP
jgi:hypothetical protein